MSSPDEKSNYIRPDKNPQPEPNTRLDQNICSDADTATVVIDAGGFGLLGDIAALWRYRELMFFLIWRDLRVRYRQTILGAAWAILQPVMSMVVFSIILGKWVGLESGGVPYPIFVYAGLLPWTLFNGAVSQGSMSLLNNSHLFTKVYFPRALLPLSTVGMVVVDFLLASTVYAGILLWYGFAPPSGILWLPVVVLLALTLSVGMSLLLAGLAVMYRDLRAIIPFMLQTWMYLSPVMYPVTLIPDKHRWILRLNPLVGIIDAFRACLIGSEVNTSDIAASAAISVFILIVGIATFKITEKKLADIA